LEELVYAESFDVTSNSILLLLFSMTEANDFPSLPSFRHSLYSPENYSEAGFKVSGNMYGHIVGIG
jgi:hypothetical protein